jgi:hypothetical protein
MCLINSWSLSVAGNAINTANQGIGKGKLEAISRPGLGHLDRTGGEFDDRVCGEAGRNPPGRHPASDFLHSLFTVDVDEVYGKLHAEGVYCFTRNDPETFSLGEAVASKQALSSRWAMVGDLYTMRECSPSGQVPNLQWGVRFRAAAFGFATPVRPSQGHGVRVRLDVCTQDRIATSSIGA